MKKILKNSMVLLVFLFVVCCFSACGCDHEWQEASCVEPKTCILCGKTEGGTIEHNYMDANCIYPKRCSYCDLSQGKALGHDYVNGYCTRCYEKDPNFVDLETFGFQNMYGMTEWIEIKVYDFAKGYVKTDMGTGAYSLKTNYMSAGMIYAEDMLTGKINDSDWGVHRYEIVDNSVAYSSWYEDLIIKERVASNKKGYLVLKTRIQGKERWLVPAELIDFSKTVQIEEDGRKRIKMFFKDKAY